MRFQKGTWKSNLSNFRFHYDDQYASARTTQNRRSRQEVFCETSSFKSFEKFRGKHQNHF